MEVGWGKIVIDNINSDQDHDYNTELRFRRRDYDYQSSIWAPKQNDPGLAFCFFKTGDQSWTYSTLVNKTGFYPWHQGVENLGSSSKKWQAIYGNSIYGSTINGNTITGTTITGDAVNGTTITGGTVNGTTIKENGTLLINKYAPVVTQVESANHLDWTNGNTVASGTWTSLGSYRFPAGKFLVLTRVEVAGNASGNRQVMWTLTAPTNGNPPTWSQTPSAWTQQSYEGCAGGTGWTNMQSVFYVAPTATTIPYLAFYQNSGTALRTYVYVQIIAI